MKYILSILIVAFAWPALAQVTRLDTVPGLQGAYLIPVKGAKRVDVQVVILSGTYDEAGPPGAAHLAEHYVALSADRKTFRRNTARDMNAQTFPISTVYTNGAQTHELETLLRHAREVFNPVDLPQKFLEDEVDIVQRELEYRSRLSFSRAPRSDAVTALYGEDTGRARNQSSSRENLAHLKPQDALDFIDRHYFPGNAIVIISGQFDPKQAEDMLIAAFGDVSIDDQVHDGWLYRAPPSDRQELSRNIYPEIADDYLVYTRFVSFDDIGDPLRFQVTFHLAATIWSSVGEKGLRSKLFFDSFLSSSFSTDSYMSITGELELTSIQALMPGARFEDLHAHTDAAFAEFSEMTLTDDEFRQAQVSAAESGKRAWGRPQFYLDFYRNFASDGIAPVTPQQLSDLVYSISKSEVEAFLNRLGGDAATSVVYARKGEI